MNIRTYTPDYAYLAQNQQAGPSELIGVHMEHDGQEVHVLVEDTPYLVAAALEALACATRRKWPLRPSGDIHESVPL